MMIDITSPTPLMTFNSDPKIVEDVTVNLLGEEYVIPAAPYPTGEVTTMLLAVVLKLHQRVEELEHAMEN